VVVGYWAYKCIETRWQDVISPRYSRKYPDALFLVVDLAVRNNDKTASARPPVKLVDAKDREYQESADEIFLDDSLGMLKTLNPGVTTEGTTI
jgi:hypothetical protein